MLRLKQIDLVGFKSFCTREHLKFAGNGLAAVVGPNGCGKSNICDAVNWVLGEQSAKSLRGGRMHDVIFAGTRHRKPAGMAKVTLTLHDPDDTLERLFSSNGRSGAPKVPASPTPGEIAVTRKLFSNGTSQYILNGKTVRLRRRARPVPRHRSRPEPLRHHRAGPHRTALDGPLAGPQGIRGRGRRRDALQVPPQARRAQARQHRTEPRAGPRHPPGSRAPGEFSQAPGGTGPSATRRTVNSCAKPSA